MMDHGSSLGFDASGATTFVAVIAIVALAALLVYGGWLWRRSHIAARSRHDRLRATIESRLDALADLVLELEHPMGGNKGEIAARHRAAIDAYVAAADGFGLARTAEQLEALDEQLRSAEHLLEEIAQGALSRNRLNDGRAGQAHRIS